MKQGSGHSNTLRMMLVAVLILACAALAIAGSKKTETPGQVVDSGTFGIYVRGQRVASETFTIKKFPDYSTTTSEIKLTDGNSAQTAEMVLEANGDLRRYEWKDVTSKAVSVLEPKDQFLIQRVTGTDKPTEQSFLMPAATIVLDDYFFSHREILIWKYLAVGCQVQAGQNGCPLPPSQFGTVIPRQRTSSMVSVAYVGREKVTVRGKEMDLSRFTLTNDGVDWKIYIDDEKKVQRIVIESDGTDVLRE